MSLLPSHKDMEINGPQSHRVTEINQNINFLTQRIIGCAIEVHRVLGPGLLEPMYESAMCIELDDAGLKYERQTRLPAYYKGRPLGEYRVDLIVDDLVLVEIKSVEKIAAVEEAQVINYLKASGSEVGLLLNFGKSSLFYRRFAFSKSAVSAESASR